MNRENENKSSIRLILPMMILALGGVLIRWDVSIFSLSTHEITTAGIGLFALGAFTFIILIHDSQNHVMETKELISLSHVLVIYAAILTMFAYENIFALETIVLTIFIMLMLGTCAALIISRVNISRFDVAK